MPADAAVGCAPGGRARAFSLCTALCQPGQTNWTLATGRLGEALALLRIGLASDREGLQRAARTALAEAVDGWGRGSRENTGLFTGFAGFAFVLAEFADVDARYSNSFERAAAEFAATVRAALPGLEQLPAMASDRVRDLFDGTVGWLCCSLRLRRTARGTLHRDLDRLTGDLVRFLATPHGTTPVAAHLLPTDESHASAWYRELYGTAHTPLGVAHGAAGTLAALSLAVLEGFDLPGLSDAVRHIALWFIEHRSRDTFGDYWLAALGHDARTGRTVRDPRHTVPASWCKGTTGICGALALAAAAAGDMPELRPLASAALHAELSRQAAGWTGQEGLCHGRAGIGLVLSRTALLLNDEVLAAARDVLTQVTCRTTGTDESSENDRSLLTGAAGFALALSEPLTDPTLSWPRLFALA